MLGKQIDVIALCSASGELSPLRLRLEDGTAGFFRLDIDRVVKRTTIETIGSERIVFLCRATVGERQELIRLCYALRTHTWHLLRPQDSFTTNTSPNSSVEP